MPALYPNKVIGVLTTWSIKDQDRDYNQKKHRLLNKNLNFGIRKKFYTVKDELKHKKDYDLIFHSRNHFKKFPFQIDGKDIFWPNSSSCNFFPIEFYQKKNLCNNIFCKLLQFIRANIFSSHFGPIGPIQTFLIMNLNF